MKTFQQFNEETPKEFVDSGQADELKNAALKFMFNKFDKVVEKGNKKYNEFKNKANK